MPDYQVPDPLPLDQQQGEAFASLVRVMRILLSPEGCPWDREQSMASLRPFVLEEACEVVDAIDSGDPSRVCEELGDLSLQIAFLAELARESGAFGPDDVVRGICEKLVRRHPHVFGSVEVDGAADVERNWEAIKVEEKGERRLLDGIPVSFPALARAQRVSDEVSRVGFDWPDGSGSRAKVDEELAELDEAVQAGGGERAEQELGDVLFALVNYARHAGVDAERALRETTNRFTRRFAHVEQRVRETRGGWPVDARGRPARGIPLEELDRHWEAAKREERRG